MSTTKTKESAKTPLPSMDEAMDAVMTKPAITLAELAVLTGTSLATTQRHALTNTLPEPIRTARIGQRWIVPSAGVRRMLELDAEQVAS
ncbi:Uncharacterised protein [Mycobacteroides abscessus subsp. abscessus]|uniref:hypothetical protein n=1 Tax=Mycobacteroides abscessus TaxID=36809 RepID=UPI000928370E|nr:hypothetical protein [Mycobacteroides abscessus]SIC64877.1 Uncharacterised protein [Mycobacteroides abscessus subsp. abscessus]SIG65840.1 Uncharacterised protein [Mycobacteroides abscessus subsp. abscessus]